MVTSNHTTTSYRLAPPPVRPADQQTEFAVGDALLLDFGAGEMTVVIGSARVVTYRIRPNLTITETLYTVRFYSPDGQQLRNSLVGVGEKRLKAAFRSYIWWMV